MSLEWIEFDPPEKCRTYIFPGGDRLEIFGVKRLCVRPSGNHRIETVDNHKYIIKGNWLSIQLDVDHWTS